ncbi:MAG: ABC-F family ATP-binding cassette domain-containing protein [Solirubrobacteraceae bacterium]|nr:ABC-F family ATP-binding cassette domain-containing protein [Solirubrobacteraceae bacterium]
MAVIIASELAKDMVGEPLFRKVSLSLERRDRMVIGGRNGAGKTTLLRILAGEEAHDGGNIVLEKNARIALHDQRPPRDQTLSLEDYALSGCTVQLELEAELAECEAKMAEGDERALERYGDLYARFEAVGGYGWRDRAGQMLTALGFADEARPRPLSSFSGGQLTRASLARALASEPDVLLLDEPTNHLDLESLEWLEDTIKSLDAAVIMVAHDRWFLEAVGTSILELEGGRGYFFKGTWSQWRKEKAQRELNTSRQMAKQQEEIARLERFINRFGAKATKAKQAQSRAKQLDKVKGNLVQAEAKDGAGLEFKFAKAERSGKIIYELSDGRVEVPGKVLVSGAEFYLERGEHVVLVGPNGAGKTTLVATLAGRRELAAGKLLTGHGVKVGYLSQHVEEIEYGTARTVLEACQRKTGLAPNPARSLLGRFLFSGDDVNKDVHSLSGGERQRLGLAALVASGANILILDEPTNHLDIESREALEDALRSFDGAVILVTHDRALLEAVGTRTVAIEDGTLVSHMGDWVDYMTSREEKKALREAVAARRAAEAGTKGAGKSNGGAAPTAAAKPKPANGSGSGKPAASAPKPKTNGNGAGPSNGVKPGTARRAGAKELAKLEREVERAEEALATIEDELADPGIWADPKRAPDATKRHEAAKARVATAYAAWESAGG